MLKQDKLYLKEIESKILEHENKVKALKSSIEDVKKDVVSLEHKRELILLTGDTSKLPEVKKINSSIEKKKEELNNYYAMLQVIESNFKTTIKSELDTLTLARESREIECRELQEVHRKEFEELLYKQWKAYDAIEEIEKAYLNFNSNLRRVYEELGIDLNEDSNKLVNRVFQYQSNYRGATTVLYDLQKLTWQGFTPSRAVEQFIAEHEQLK